MFLKRLYWYPLNTFATLWRVYLPSVCQIRCQWDDQLSTVAPSLPLSPIHSPACMAHRPATFLQCAHLCNHGDLRGRPGWQSISICGRCISPPPARAGQGGQAGIFFFFSINNFKSVLGSNIKIKANTLKSAKPYGHVIDNVVVPTMLYSHTMQMLIP